MCNRFIEHIANKQVKMGIPFKNAENQIKATGIFLSEEVKNDSPIIFSCPECDLGGESLQHANHASRARRGRSGGRRF